MRFRDRIKTLFMLDRDTLGAPYTHHLSDVDVRELLTEFFNAFPEVRTYVEDAVLYEYGPSARRKIEFLRNVEVPLRHAWGTMTGRLRSGHPSLDSVPRFIGIDFAKEKSGPVDPNPGAFVAFHDIGCTRCDAHFVVLADHHLDHICPDGKGGMHVYPGGHVWGWQSERYGEGPARSLKRPFFERTVSDDLVGQQLGPGDVARFFERMREIEGLPIDVETPLPPPVVEKEACVVDGTAFATPVLALIDWMKTHASPSHQITAERMLKEWDVFRGMDVQLRGGDTTQCTPLTHGELVQWFLDHWSPSAASTVERLERDHVILKREG